MDWYVVDISPVTVLSGSYPGIKQHITPLLYVRGSEIYFAELQQLEEVLTSYISTNLQHLQLHELHEV